MVETHKEQTAAATALDVPNNATDVKPSIESLFESLYLNYTHTAPRKTASSSNPVYTKRTTQMSTSMCHEQKILLPSFDTPSKDQYRNSTRPKDWDVRESLHLPNKH